MKPQLLMIRGELKYIVRFISWEILEFYLNKKLDKLGISYCFETVYEKLNLLNEVNYVESHQMDKKEAL